MSKKETKKYNEQTKRNASKLVTPSMIRLLQAKFQTLDGKKQ